MIALHSDTAGRTPTTVGHRIGWRRRLTEVERAAVRRQLEGGPWLDSFDSVGGVRDISADPSRVHLVRFSDERVLGLFDDAVEQGRR